jgi:hypothetical protein
MSGKLCNSFVFSIFEQPIANSIIMAGNGSQTIYAFHQSDSYFRFFTIVSAHNMHFAGLLPRAAK